MTVGILAEKNSAARNIATALGGMSGTYNGEQYVVVAARGHLYGFVMPDKMVDKNLAEYYKKWDIANLPWDEKDFTWKYAPGKDTRDVLNKIKTTLDACDEIAIATDVDPSGEGGEIAYEIIKGLHLNKRGRKISRVYWMDETPKEVQRAFKDRKVIKDLETFDEHMMAFYRGRFDFLTMQFSRIATKVGDGKSILRQGRLKSAMVKLVGEQIDAHNSYVKTVTYQNQFVDENGVKYIWADEPVYEKKSDVPTDVYHSSAVVCDKPSIKHTAPPKLLDLASLSALLAPKGLKPKDLLSIYQKMYEAQYVSYPRTEDAFVSEEQFNELLPVIDKIASVVGADTSKLTHRTPRMKTHVRSGGAHGANRPGVRVPQSLEWLDQEFGKHAGMIYEVLAKNYLRMLAEDYEYEHQPGHVKDFPKFKGSANVPLKLGWKEVFFSDDDDQDDLENKKGLGTQAEPVIAEIVPKRPQWPTWSWLKAQLEKHDVGTGATRVSTFSEVTSSKVKYPLLSEKRGRISMTEYGDMSYRLLPNTHIGDIKLTEKVQKDMRAVAKGEASPDALLAEVAQLVKDDIVTMTANGKSMRKELGIMGTGEAVERYSGIWRGQNVNFKREFGGHRFTDEECEKLCNDEYIEFKATSKSSGSEYLAYGKLDNREWDGRKYVGFGLENKPDSPDYFYGEWVGNPGKRTRFKKQWSGHEFSQAEADKLFAGETISFKTMSKKTQNEYIARGKLEWCEYNGHKYVGFQMSTDTPPSSWGGHQFDEAEMQLLMDGKELHLTGLQSKRTGNNYDATIVWKEDETGKKRIQFAN